MLVSSEVRAQGVARWAVLNCPCTRVLGLYQSGGDAARAAESFGSASFAYELSDAELAAMRNELAEIAGVES